MGSDEIFRGSESLYPEALGMLNAIRQNHALEHATVALLLTRLEGKVRLVGRAGLTGFYIYGDIPTETLEEAAREGLRRLQEGEKDLAVSPMCGTNVAVAGFCAGIAAMIAGRGSKGLTKFNRVINASVIAVLAAQPLGRLAQKYITTTPDLDNVSIARVVKRGEGKRTRHKVELIYQ